MQSRNVVSFIVLLSSLLFLVGCGGAQPSTPIPPTPIPPQPTATLIQVPPTSTPIPPVPPPPMSKVLITGRNSYPVVRLTNRLGVEATVEINGYEGEFVLLHFYDYYGQLPLKVADGVYMLIPLKMFRRAYAIGGGIQRVTLVDGQEFDGQLTGSLWSGDLSRVADRSTYQLEYINTMVLTSLPEWMNEESKNPEGEAWQLRSEPLDLTLSISELAVAYRYFSTSGYVVGGEYRVAESPSFHIRVGQEDFRANFLDFDEIAFTERPGLPTAIDVTVTAGSVVSQGEFYPSPDAYDWYLVAKTANSGITFVFKDPAFVVVTKVPN